MGLFLWYLFRGKAGFEPYVKHFRLGPVQKQMFRKIMGLGFPSALQFFFEVAIFTAAIWMSGTLGKNPQAANQIALNLSSMTFMFATGLGVTAMIRVGNQLGQQNFPELRRIATSIFLMTVLTMSLFGVLFLLGRFWLPTLYLDLSDSVNFNDNLEVIQITASLLIISALFQISDGMQVVVLGALRGLQDVRIPTLITFIAYWLIGFPASYFFGLYWEMGSFGIWIGLLLGLTASAIMLYIRFRIRSAGLILDSSYTK
jgi:MATE family multidrug resistance protein